MYTSEFWAALDKLAETSQIVIDRPKGSAHPRFTQYIYPLDYGYLEGTSSMDGEGIDLWLGTDPAGKLTAILCTVDLIKRDSEIKLLLGCTEEEIQTVLAFHNQSELMRGMLVRHLLLPGAAGDCIRLMAFLAEELPGVPLSLMRQYTPIPFCTVKGLDRRVTDREYDRVLQAAADLHITGYFQDRDSADSAYTPVFDGTGIREDSADDGIL